MPHCFILPAVQGNIESCDVWVPCARMREWIGAFF